MQEEWWERTVCWVCDHWWALLLLLMLPLVLYVSRPLWLPPLSGTPEPPPFPSPPPVPTLAAGVTMSPFPFSTPVSTLTARTTMIPSPSSTPVPKQGYVNLLGGYALNYPATWKGIETGTDAHFKLPNGSSVQIAVISMEPGQTISDFLAETGPIPLDVRKAQAIVANEPAIKHELLQAGDLIGIVYSVAHNLRLYHLALYAAESGQPLDNFEQSVQEFNEMVNSFSWLVP